MSQILFLLSITILAAYILTLGQVSAIFVLRIAKKPVNSSSSFTVAYNLHQ